jgi:hypothetical protein
MPEFILKRLKALDPRVRNEDVIDLGNNHIIFGGDMGNFADRRRGRRRR